MQNILKVAKNIFIYAVHLLLNSNLHHQLAPAN